MALWCLRVHRNEPAAADAHAKHQASDAVEHASGVYFSNRAHQVRIHAKRLRYLVELASATTRPRDDRELTVLKRVQSVLGDLHDRELLLKRLDQCGAQGAEIDTLRQRLIAERDDLFKDYLSRRDELREVSDSIRRRTAERQELDADGGVARRPIGARHRSRWPE